ncbi:MAG: PH domain-containing protein [Salaquimonas sp.]
MPGVDIEELDDSSRLEIPDEHGSMGYRADWKIFIPTFIILISYGLSMLYLWATGRVDSALFRLAAIVAGIGVPLLLAHAFLRYETICVRLSSSSTQFHRGWPKKSMTSIPFELVTGMSVKRGLFGRLWGGGTLIVKTKGGIKTAISDLKDPEKIVAEYHSHSG